MESPHRLPRGDPGWAARGALDAGSAAASIPAAGAAVLGLLEAGEDTEHAGGVWEQECPIVKRAAPGDRGAVDVLAWWEQHQRSRFQAAGGAVGAPERGCRGRVADRELQAALAGVDDRAGRDGLCGQPGDKWRGLAPVGDFDHVEAGAGHGGEVGVGVGLTPLSDDDDTDGGVVDGGGFDGVLGRGLAVGGAARAGKHGGAWACPAPGAHSARVEGARPVDGQDCDAVAGVVERGFKGGGRLCGLVSHGPAPRLVVLGPARGDAWPQDAPPHR